MVQYRHNRVAGGCYFFTVTLRDRQSDVLVRYIDLLRESFRHVKSRHDFTIDAIVVLPDHLHTIWTLPEVDDDYPSRWRAIKSHFTRSLKRQGYSLTRDKRGEYRLWQRRYWEHTIYDEVDFQRCVDYIHFNPIKHGYVKHLQDWPYSSFHRFVEEGKMSIDWGINENIIDELNFGER